MRSPPQISLERKAWARGKLITAWLFFSKETESPNLTPEKLGALERDLFDARAIAAEWGLDARRVLEEQGELAR